MPLDKYSTLSKAEKREIKNAAETLDRNATELEVAAKKLLDDVIQLQDEIETHQEVSNVNGSPIQASLRYKQSEKMKKSLQRMTDKTDEMLKDVPALNEIVKEAVENSAIVDQLVKEMNEKEMTKYMSYDAYDHFVINALKKVLRETEESYVTQTQYVAYKKSQVKKKDEILKTTKDKEEINKLKGEIKEADKEAKTQENFAAQTEERVKALQTVLETLENAQVKKKDMKTAAEDGENKLGGGENLTDYEDAFNKVYTSSQTLEKKLNSIEKQLKLTK